MKISYLFLAHNNLAGIEKVIRNLKSDITEFYIHLDLKSLEDCSSLAKFESVTFIKSRHYVQWGGFSIIEALMDSCKEIIEEDNNDYIVLLSGTDYPLKNKDYINSFLATHPNKDFIEGKQFPSENCHWLEGGRRRLECYALRIGDKDIATIEPKNINLGNIRQFGKIMLKSPSKLNQALKIWLTYPKRSHPNSLIPYYGEMWWCLRRSTLEKILHYVYSHPEFIDYHRNTCIPDEIFFPTLVYNLIPKNEIENNCLRLINWGVGIPGNSPKDISLNDKEIIDKAINNPNYLFGRKIIYQDTINYINDKIR